MPDDDIPVLRVVANRNKRAAFITGPAFFSRLIFIDGAIPIGDGHIKVPRNDFADGCFCSLRITSVGNTDHFIVEFSVIFFDFR